MTIYKPTCMHTNINKYSVFKLFNSKIKQIQGLELKLPVLII